MHEISLNENIYNRQTSGNTARFKIWSSIGLMLTYRCSSRCVCCYVFSGPESGSSDTEMSVESAIDYWRGVRNLAGERGKVHITGGEPFLDYERLCKLLQAGQEQGLGGLEKIETNASWCSSASLAHARLGELKCLGLKKLQVSTDIYHQQYVPLECVRLAVEAGRKILGDQGVQVRWEDFLAGPELVDAMPETQRRAAFATTVAQRRERMVGRAAEELASLFPSRDYDSFAEVNCRGALLGAKHVHIDGAGNVFSGTCAGIIVGNPASEGPGGFERLWRSFDFRKHPIYSILAAKGPVGLLRLAEPLGYRPLRGYADKCHLCYDIRRYLYQKGRYHQYLGPGVCYGQPANMGER